MDIRRLENEIDSPAIREIVRSLWEVVDRVQTGKIQSRQAGVEVAAHRHFLQAISLDWFYNKQKKVLTPLKEERHPEFSLAERSKDA